MGRWKLGTSTEKVAPRSYMVDIQGRLYRRNRKFLRTTKEDKTLAEQMSQQLQNHLTENQKEHLPQHTATRYSNSAGRYQDLTTGDIEDSTVY